MSPVPPQMSVERGFWARLVAACLAHRGLVGFLVVGLAAAGVYVSPFAWDLGPIPRDPVPVDALPDQSENQQIVFSEWSGRAPRDVDEQITQPLSSALLGLPKVQTVRSTSAFGFSSLTLVFEDAVDPYWARSRVLEALAALPPDRLPAGVRPVLGPDATAMGQVFWYTLEGRDEHGSPAGGWDLDELRSVQDWTVRYALEAVPGVAEVASIGGFVREYQVDVDPDALVVHEVRLSDVADAVRGSNLDAGARTLEVNGVEYVVRALGRVEELEDLEEAVVVRRGGTPIRIRDVARVSVGPALRRGALDDAGAPAVGGVVVARQGTNPVEVIAAVRAKIDALQAGLPSRNLEDGRNSRVTVVPFYDRTTLVHEALGTLSGALLQQVLMTVLVVLVMLRAIRAPLLVSVVVPLGVLSTFVCMKVLGVDANLLSLAGIAIALGTMVDVGIVLVDAMQQRLRAGEPRRTAIARATAEVAPALVTSVATTVVSFLPVLALPAQDLRVFGPLAATKTFAMVAALGLALVILPVAGERLLRADARPPGRGLTLLIIGVAVTLLSRSWLPLGPDAGAVANLVFVAGLVGVVLGALLGFEAAYPALLAVFLRRKKAFLLAPTVVAAFAALVWKGAGPIVERLPPEARAYAPVAAFEDAFGGLGTEYMPALDEGAFLFMPSTMPHASIGEVQRMLAETDAAIAAIPEVDRVVGKLGRVNSALDPAPLEMIETLITYHPEYRVGEDGSRVRRWRDHIRTPRDIWDEIVAAAARPGLTSAPVLMPIEARRVMLQTGMRGALGFRVQGPDSETVETFGLELEAVLREVPEVRPETVFADRSAQRPYLEIDLNRRALGRYGLTVEDVQRHLQVALGGVPLTWFISGRERYPMRVRYMRETRDSVEALRRISIDTDDRPVPLSLLADIRFAVGPRTLRAEDAFATGYVLFDRRPGVGLGEAAEAAEKEVAARIREGRLSVPAGIVVGLAGEYQAQLRSERRLQILIPLALVLILLLLHLQFRRPAVSLIIFSGVVVAVAGGFVLLWLYGQPGFADFELFGASMRTVFRVGPVHLSVAVWVGFIALAGIATDDGVVMATLLRQRFRSAPPATLREVHHRAIEAGVRRLRPCLATTATTILALLPVIGARGRGADLMMPMALPIVGGTVMALITLFVVPVLYAAVEERRLETRRR